LPIIPKLLRRVENEKYKKGVEKKFRYFQNRKKKILNSFKRGYKIHASTFGIPTDIYDLKKEFVVAEVDQDGFFLPFIDKKYIEFLPLTSEEYFLKRERFKIFLVISHGYLGIKKNYRGNKYRFLKELESLYKLSEKDVNVPTILDIDFNNLTIIISFIDGEVLREKLAEQGALIRDKQVGKNSDYTYVKRKIVAGRRLKEGRRFLPKVIDKEVFLKLSQQLNEIHKCGIIINDIKYGNIIIENNTKEPYFIDFETATILEKSFGLKYNILANFERKRLIKHFKSML